MSTGGVGGPTDEAERAQTRQATSVATDQAARVASGAADQARRVGAEAASEARDLAFEARQSVRRQGEAQADQAAQALARLRDQGRALLEGRPEDAGVLVEHGHTVVERLDSLTRRLETGGLDGAVRDLERFARRRPLAFLAGAGLLGLAAGRIVRANRDDSQAERSQGSGLRESHSWGPGIDSPPGIGIGRSAGVTAAEPTVQMPPTHQAAGAPSFGSQVASPPPAPPPAPPTVGGPGLLPDGYLDPEPKDR